MKEKQTVLSIGLVFISLFMGCTPRNPLMQLDDKTRNMFIAQHGHLEVADVCAEYYINGIRSKVTRTSVICSEYTRELLQDAKKKKLTNNKLKVEHFRDKRIWENWLNQKQGILRELKTLPPKNDRVISP